MEANPILFRDLTYIFLAAVLGGMVAWQLRLPLILGFIFGGIVVSPFTPGPHLSNLHTFEVFAEVGVVLLMFSIGVEFSIPDLLRVKWVALAGGPIGILLIVGIAATAAKFLGWSLTEGAVIGATVSVASTMVLARLLRDTGELATTLGRVVIGITLVEGQSIHQEFDELAKAGLSPFKILQMTTLYPAEFLGRTATMGSIEIGKNADIVLLNGNPVENVQNLHSIAGVVRAGFYYSHHDLDALRERAKEPPKVREP
jgi:hypothetical protein